MCVTYPFISWILIDFWGERRGAALRHGHRFATRKLMEQEHISNDRYQFALLASRRWVAPCALVGPQPTWSQLQGSISFHYKFICPNAWTRARPIQCIIWWHLIANKLSGEREREKSRPSHSCCPLRSPVDHHHHQQHSNCELYSDCLSTALSICYRSSVLQFNAITPSFSA